MRTSEFRDLHQSWLTLPCAWDALSGAVFGHAGYKAIGTTSAGVAWSLGLPDGGLTRGDAVAAARRIVEATDCLVSVDVENGYSSDPTVVAGLLIELADIGVVGVNIEDQGPEGQRSTGEFADWLGHVLESTRKECDLFVNVRIDTWLTGQSGPSANADVVARAIAYSEAGADGIFVPGAPSPDAAAQVVAATSLPVNIMGDLGDRHEPWSDVGVRRLSSGMGTMQALYSQLLATAVHNNDDDALDLDFATIQRWFA